MAIQTNRLKDVVFTTSNPPQALHLKGSVVINSPLQFPTVNHGLGYVPYVRVVYEYPDGSGNLRTASYNSGSYVQVAVEPTEQLVRFNAFNNLGPGNPSFTSNCRIYYRIYRRTF